MIELDHKHELESSMSITDLVHNSCFSQFNSQFEL